MKEHYQLFSGPMVLAILGGFKDMTRRLVTPENSLIDFKSARTREGKALWAKLDWKRAISAHSQWIVGEKRTGRGKAVVHLVNPYVRAWDTLIGKETFVLETSHGEYPCAEPKDRPFKRDDDGSLQVPHYRATEPEPHIVPWDRMDSDDDRTIWQPSIFMPKWASRLRLEVTDTFPQRLQDIPAGDVAREGLKQAGNLWAWPGYPGGSTNPVYAYQLLWDMLNDEAGKRWCDNPPVWVRVFKRL